MWQDRIWQVRSPWCHLKWDSLLLRHFHEERFCCVRRTRTYHLLSFSQRKHPLRQRVQSTTVRLRTQKLMSWSWLVITWEWWWDTRWWKRYHFVRWSESQIGISKSTVCQWRHLFTGWPDLSCRRQSSQRNLRKSHLTTVQREDSDSGDSSNQLLTGMRLSHHLGQRRSHSQR